jgi:hypothetical protein
MNGQDFTRITSQAFAPFLSELDFVEQPTQISGRAYHANFFGKGHTLSVSFEPGDDYFSIMLIANEANDLASIDDRAKTPRLSDLNARYAALISPSEREANEDYFAGVVVNHPFERQLLKFAKELRLVLPKHLAA